MVSVSEIGSPDISLYAIDGLNKERLIGFSKHKIPDAASSLLAIRALYLNTNVDAHSAKSFDTAFSTLLVL